MLNQQSELLDQINVAKLTGFRLEYLEVYNWGTFNHNVWRIEPDSQNALLTGDIGSGKSTLVDAITTLLVPHHRIIYNRAAGAEGKERTLYSYIRGEYKNEQDDTTQMAKAIALRGENSYSVLLANFHNQSLMQSVTLAQVFWLKDNQRNPERFFVLSQTPLNITQHFSNFGPNISQLKKNLNALAQVKVVDNFKEYSSKFRQLFGIQNEQALDLFYQTISMKSIGNLTDFVRSHMLEKSLIANLLHEIEHNFENLNQAHLVILKVKDQIRLLAPLSDLGREFQQIQCQIEELSTCNALVDGFMAQAAQTLYQEQGIKLEHLLQRSEFKCQELREQTKLLRGEEQKIHLAIETHGGQRLRELEQEINQLTNERERKSKLADKYYTLIAKLKLKFNGAEGDFYDLQQQIGEIQQHITVTLAELNEQATQLRISMKLEADNITATTAEIASLRSRQSNIPSHILNLRASMAETLGISQELLPFVGELIQIDPSQKDWAGAIERVLHNFGLSLLVTDEYYAAVSSYVEQTNLRGKLVYYRVKEEVIPHQESTKNTLRQKIAIKRENRFYPWLNQQILSRFNYICCDTLDDFRRYPLALSINGQIKSAGWRHEKDDRHLITDASRYILGWDNRDKLQILSQQLKQLEANLNAYRLNLLDLNQQQNASNEQRDVCRDLNQFNSFNDIHWQELVTMIAAKQAEKKALTDSSDILHSLRASLDKLRQELTTLEATLSQADKKSGAVEQELESNLHNLRLAAESLAAIAPDQQQKFFPRLAELKDTELKSNGSSKYPSLTLVNLKKCQEDLRLYLTTTLAGKNKRKNTLNSNIISTMQVYKSAYPVECSEVDVSLEALAEYLAQLSHLQADDLPRHELRFKQLLNEGTINSIALLQNQLKKEENAIRAKIGIINQSLYGIEYNSGTYIALLADSSYDLEIREFREQLRNCLSNTIEPNSQNTYYSEEKFKHIKVLIDRFRGRPEVMELDKRWTQKVTDVRNWFNFSASERFIEDQVEKEFYSDSAGKSGGQKEKLAYTILASALVYQFGLEPGGKNSRSFRFVVIDEAFGRGSDESTRYGLELFKRLNLQLLIITPLQKIRIIEDYISAVHFVHNEGGCNSQVHNLSIAEYKAQADAASPLH